jgi:hypothetical protein
MIEFLIGMALFLFLLVVLGICADSWDSRERRDARRRNR